MVWGKASSYAAWRLVQGQDVRAFPSNFHVILGKQLGELLGPFPNLTFLISLNEFVHEFPLYFSSLTSLYFYMLP